MKTHTLSMMVCIAAANFTVMANAQEPVCHNNGSGSDSAICTNEQLVIADAQLNDAYQSAFSLLSTDSDRADARAALVVAQREWIRLRDADCQVQDFIFLQGTTRAAIVQSCLKDLTGQRIKELKQIGCRS